ncbi:CCA tRNA nucleotidyltransferase [Pseudonocardia kongjuensis]|uniref:CCA tRNA nucleotidyltransferase n=2 Tax=Pseudonocardia kongjuensis TaxID=102227 RepID=A0ABN1XYZ3_9PSEU
MTSAQNPRPAARGGRESGPGPDPEGLKRSQEDAVMQMLDVPAVADELAARFAERGHRIYLVGGSVRDALLRGTGVSDRDSGDLDFTTDARPEQILEAVRGWADAVWDTGIAFGTVGLRRRDQVIEVTTFRADTYDGRSRNPEVRFGDDIEGDLVRRDFTVNAMAVELGERRFVDPHGGFAALAQGVLDTPDLPERSFADDPLRMLRAARFVSQLGFTPADRVTAAMTAMADELSRITAERVQAEFSKLVLGAHPRRGIELLCDTGLAQHVVPEVPAMQLETDEHMQHKDVYTHSLVVMEQAIERETDGPDLTLRLAALLHDIGKPATRRKEPDGRVSFHHHEVVGAKMTRKRLRALKYPKALIDDVSQLVYLHLRFHGYGKGEWSDSAVRRYVTDAGPLLDRLHQLVRSDCTTRNRRRAAALQRNYDGLERRIAELRKQEELDAIRPDLDGNQIMRLLGIPPGPAVGRAYQHLLALRMEQGPLGPDEAEAALRAWAAENL